MALLVGLHAPELKTLELLACMPEPRPTTDAFKQWERRGHLRPTNPTGPGRGNYSLYTPSDLLQTTVLHELQLLGVAVGQAAGAWPPTEARAVEIWHQPSLPKVEQVLVCGGTDLSGWTPVEVSDGLLPLHDHPQRLVVLQIDRIIGAVRERMSRLLAPYLPRPVLPLEGHTVEVVRQLVEQGIGHELREYRDRHGRRAYVGLTHHETEHLEALQRLQDISGDALRRRQELSARHERVWHAHVAAANHHRLKEYD